MKSDDNVTDKLDSIFMKYKRKVKSNGMSVTITNEDGSFTWSNSSGNLAGDQQFFIASVTKLFATTVLLNLIDEGKISFDDKICKYLPKEYCENLHNYKGKDYTSELTVKDLMTQTSGLPDYYTESSKGYLAESDLLKHDQTMTLDEVVERTRKLNAKFAPGSKKKAYYSDANWDLFLPIVEKLSGMTVEQCYDKYIITPLGLKNTYLFTKGMEFTVPAIWINDAVYKFPKLACGWPMSGSIISNNHDMIIFLKAFWSGKLFNLRNMQSVNTYYYTQFFPMEYGLGNARFRYPGEPTLYGHSGATGVVCYYAPKYKMYISACINELNEVKATRMLAHFSRQYRNIK